MVGREGVRVRVKMRGSSLKGLSSRKGRKGVRVEGIGQDKMGSRGREGWRAERGVKIDKNKNKNKK